MEITYYSPSQVKLVSTAFLAWCDANRANVDMQEEHTHTVTELYDRFISETQIIKG